MAGYKRKGRRRGTKRSKQWSPSRKASAKRRVTRTTKKRTATVAKKKAAVTKVIRDVVKPGAIKRPFITPKTPAIISQQIGKIKRIPLLIIGVVVVVYAIIKKVFK